jgi:hypothetical protein
MLIKCAKLNDSFSLVSILSTRGYFFTKSCYDIDLWPWKTTNFLLSSEVNFYRLSIFANTSWRGIPSNVKKFNLIKLKFNDFYRSTFLNGLNIMDKYLRILLWIAALNIMEKYPQKLQWNTTLNIMEKYLQILQWSPTFKYFGTRQRFFVFVILKLWQRLSENNILMNISPYILLQPPVRHT